MRRPYSLGVVLAVSILLSFSAAAQTDGKLDFQIDTVSGEDANQINQVEIGDRGGIEVGLSNANYTDAKFMAFLDGQEMFMGDDEEITMKPEYEISEGEHELRIERQSRRDEDVSRTTQVEVIHVEGQEDTTSTNVDFEIDKIAGQDASKVNDLDVRVGERIDLEIKGAEFDESSFTAHIDSTELHVDEDGLVMVSDIKNVGTGQHELELEYYHSGGTSKASTQINIVNIEDTRTDDRSAPDEFSIKSVAGEDADQTNKLKLFERETLKVELDGMDLGRTRLKAFIDGKEFPMDEQGIRMTSEIAEVKEGEHELRIVSIFEGEEATDASTDIEVTEIETREDRRMPDELDTELFDKDFNPDIDGMDVERGDGSITFTVASEELGGDGGEVIVGNTIEDLTKLQMNYRNAPGIRDAGAKLTVEEKDVNSVQNEDIEVYAVLELSGQNLEILAPTLKFAVANKWADEHDFDNTVREIGNSRGEATEIAFYDVEEDWQRLDATMRQTTGTHSIYELHPRGIDQEFNLESKTNTIVIGGNTEGGITYAEGPQGQCQSFGPEEEVPPGWTEVDKSCTELKQLQREREQLRGSINNLKEDLQENEDRGSQEDIEKLDSAIEELDKGNVEEAEKMYNEVQDKTAKNFLRNFIIQTVKDVFPFLN